MFRLHSEEKRTKTASHVQNCPLSFPWTHFTAVRSCYASQPRPKEDVSPRTHLLPGRKQQTQIIVLGPAEEEDARGCGAESF